MSLLQDVEKRPWQRQKKGHGLFSKAQEKLKDREVRRSACGLVHMKGAFGGHGGKYYHQTPAKLFVQAQVCSSKIKDLIHMDEI